MIWVWIEIFCTIISTTCLIIFPREVERIQRFIINTKKGDEILFKYRHHDLESSRLVVRKLNDSISTSPGETITLLDEGNDQYVPHENILLP